MLAGHEHNFQINEVDGRTYVVSGAGGKVREEVPDGFAEAGTTAWAARRTCCWSSWTAGRPA